ILYFQFHDMSICILYLYFGYFVLLKVFKILSKIQNTFSYMQSEKCEKCHASHRNKKRPLTYPSAKFLQSAFLHLFALIRHFQQFNLKILQLANSSKWQKIKSRLFFRVNTLK